MTPAQSLRDMLKYKVHDMTPIDRDRYVRVGGLLVAAQNAWEEEQDDAKLEEVARGKTRGPQWAIVALKNLPLDVEEETLFALIRKFGMRLMPDKEPRIRPDRTGQRCMAFVHVRIAVDLCEKVAKLNGVLHQGYRISAEVTQRKFRFGSFG